MIAVVTLLLAFPLGYFVRSRLAASTAYAVAYLWAFIFQTLYLMLDSLSAGRRSTEPGVRGRRLPVAVRRRHPGDLRGRVRAGEPRSLGRPRRARRAPAPARARPAGTPRPARTSPRSRPGHRQPRERRHRGGREELRGVLQAQGAAGPERSGPLGHRGEGQAVVGHGDHRGQHDQRDRDRPVEPGGGAEGAASSRRPHGHPAQRPHPAAHHVGQLAGADPAERAGHLGDGDQRPGGGRRPAAGPAPARPGRRSTPRTAGRPGAPRPRGCAAGTGRRGRGSAPRPGRSPAAAGPRRPARRATAATAHATTGTQSAAYGPDRSAVHRHRRRRRCRHPRAGRSAGCPSPAPGGAAGTSRPPPGRSRTLVLAAAEPGEERGQGEQDAPADRTAASDARRPRWPTRPASRTTRSPRAVGHHPPGHQRAGHAGHRRGRHQPGLGQATALARAPGTGSGTPARAPSPRSRPAPACWPPSIAQRRVVADRRRACHVHPPDSTPAGRRTGPVS